MGDATVNESHMQCYWSKYYKESYAEKSAVDEALGLETTLGDVVSAPLLSLKAM